MKTVDGSKIRDAKKPLILHILPVDIKKADRRDPTNCAIACAARREFGVANVRIHLSRVYVMIGKNWERFMTSKALRSEIIAYDRGGAFMPGEYWLAPPSPHRRTGKQQGSQTGQTRNKSGRPRLPRHVTEGVRPTASHGGKHA